MSRNDELEKARGDYEMARLGRDVVDINIWGGVGAAVGFVTGGPLGAIVGGSIGAAGSGRKAISDKKRRDREWGDG